jgi:NADH dehydrogenase
MNQPSKESSPSLKEIVVVGAGFGGLAAIKALRRVPARVTVVDRSNHHLFQPLLYQVATAALNPSDIAAPIRRILRHQKNTRVILGEASSIDLGSRTLMLTDGELAFDYLILATGATHAYFDHDQWAADAPGLKTIDDALEIRRRVLFAFERAEREADPIARAAWLTFVVVGGGPTGVELAGTLAEVSRKTLARDFDHIDPASARIILVEGSPDVLRAYPDPLPDSARSQLERLGVSVWTQRQVVDIDSAGVSLIGGERISARTVVWAAGVAASPLGKTLGLPLTRTGQVPVEPDLSIAGHPAVFVVGDLASIQSDGKPVPGIAPAAMQMGKCAARNIAHSLRGEPREVFHYHDRGSMATIGRMAGVAQLGKMKFSGPMAWLLWLFVHILFLIGFRNRVLVFIQWCWCYITYDRGARLITGKIPPARKPPEG